MEYNSEVAPVVKWISRRASDALLWVRLLPGAQSVDNHVGNVYKGHESKCPFEINKWI